MSRQAVLVSLLISVQAVWAEDKKMERIIQKLQDCVVSVGSPGAKACSATAARESMNLMEAGLKGAETFLISASGKDARFARAAQALRKAQQNWKSFVEAHCRYRMEFNGIPAEDFEWRMNDCRITQVKERIDEFGNSFMK